MDPGDEHVDPPLRQRTAQEIAFEELLATCTVELPEHLFWAIADAEAMRSCCKACALEANGEDGS